jgi:hypothetical protein
LDFAQKSNFATEPALVLGLVLDAAWLTLLGIGLAVVAGVALVITLALDGEPPV